MASTVVVESVRAKVVEVNKRGSQGSYKQKVVQVNNKDYSVSKDDKDKVKVGQEYTFKLTKSEYNDKLYYWANLIEDDSKSGTGDSQPEDDDFKSQVFSWLNKLDVEKKKQVIKYLLDRI